MKKNVLIGGAWPYANYLMHIGHLAALLPGDVIARYYRANKCEVIYVSGSDCHGTPITQRAIKESKKPEEVANYYHQEFIKTLNKMNFTYDLYTSTMDEEHKHLVQEYFKKMLDNGYIYEKEESQDYCEKCQKYLSDREIVGICPHCGKQSNAEQCDNCLTNVNASEVKDKYCVNCQTATVMKGNKHLYFKLSAFQTKLEQYVDKSDNTWRKQAISEAKKFLKMGLIDRAATRQLTWGIEVPVTGYEDKRIYVWIEAVLGYLTAGYRVANTKGIDFDKFMTSTSLSTYYVHGKDNITFHAIIYPALILALKNNYQLPKYNISCDYVNMDSQKMSKSKGNLITVNELMEKYAVDTIRYYMIAYGPEKKDVNFSYSHLIQSHNKFLVGILGNFVNRNLSFIIKKFAGTITASTVDLAIKKETKEKYQQVGSLIEKGELKNAIESVFEYITIGNKYYDENQPWIKVKENIEEFNKITYTCIYMIANISNLIEPFLPDTAHKLKEILALVGESAWEEINIEGITKIDAAPLLFERIEEESLEE
ncbi:MAG: methionine--tRNA ligase [bacterium]|nr:methionine--tRNA ligase [bacterium]